MACKDLGGDCKMRMNLYVELPWLGSYETASGARRDGTMGVWQVDTGSWGALGSLFDEMDRIRVQYGRLTCVPVRLFKLSEPTRYKDKDGAWKEGTADIVHLAPWGETPQASVAAVDPRMVAPHPEQLKQVHRDWGLAPSAVAADPDDIEEELTKNGIPPATPEDAEEIFQSDDDPEDDLGDGDALPQGLSDADAPPATANAAGGW
jgi:hypothetical protein